MTRIVVVLVFLTVAVHEVPTVHQHVARGLFSDDCPLVRLATAISAAVPAPMERRPVLLPPRGVTTTAASRAVPSRVVPAFSSRAPPAGR